MSVTPTPLTILETLFPYLKAAAAYAQEIQSRIAMQPDKKGAENMFATALTDADLSIQTLVEVALLGSFPQILFYGEEYEQSHNTKYFRAVELVAPGEYLITLDPIDGTRFYLDGHSNYQIILSVLSWDQFEAVIAISPAQNTYYYAIRNEGAFQGDLHKGFDQCHSLQINTLNGKVSNKIFLGSKMSSIAAHLPENYEVFDILKDYSQTVQKPNLNGILNGDLTGAVLASGQFIDGAALAFLAQEAGCRVTALDGASLPPLNTCQNHRLPGLVIASSTTVHEHLLHALNGWGGPQAVPA